MTPAATKTTQNPTSNFQPNHRPSVFTQLNNRERFAAMTNNNGRTSPANSANEITGPSATTQSQQTEVIEGEWLLVGKNGKITPANRHKKEVLPVDIGSPCPEPSIPQSDASAHWQIEISFVPTSSQVVSVPKTMTAMLNHLQAVNPNTVIAPVHYKDANEEEYIVTTTDIPVDETSLDNYLVKYDNTRSGRIGLSIIIASDTTFNYFKQDKTLVKWFQAEKLSVLLDMIDVAVPRQAGFFLRLLPKAESLDLHYARICNYLPEAPPFQLVSRTLKTKNPAAQGKDRHANVVHVITEADDSDELIHHLRHMCDNVAGYEFYPLEEFHCLAHSDKITLINRQIEFAKTYASIVVSGFEHETEAFRMWMPPYEDTTTEQSNSKTLPAPTSPDTDYPTSRDDDETPQSIRIQLPAEEEPPADNDSMDFCDDKVTTFSTPISTTKAAITELVTKTMETTGHIQPVIDLETGIVRDISTCSNKRLRTTNGRVSTSSKVSISPASSRPPHQRDMENISITHFLYTIQSGDGTPLFAFVYEPVEGKRELITSKFQEATRFVSSIHPHLVRRMNNPAQAIMYPNQHEDITWAMNQPDWQPFRIFSQLAPMQPDQRPPSGSSSTMSAFSRMTPSRGRGGGRINTYQTSTTQQHWYFTNRSASHQQEFTQEPGETVASVTTVKNETFRYTPSTKTVFSKALKRPSSPSMQATAVITKHPPGTPFQTSHVTLHQHKFSSSDTSQELALTTLQSQLENMTVRQLELETRLSESSATAQSQMQNSLRDLEQRQVEYSKENNAAIQAEMARNKAEASQEMSATMQFLRMLNENATTAKAQSEQFQATLLSRLDTRESSPKTSIAVNPPVPHTTSQHSTGPTTSTPVITIASRNSTPASLPLTLLRSTNTKRHQQQSILATMAKMVQSPLGGTENEMSRHSTGHGIDGKTHRPDPSTNDPTHHT